MRLKCNYIYSDYNCMECYITGKYKLQHKVQYYNYYFNNFYFKKLREVYLLAKPVSRIIKDTPPIC